MNKWRRSITRAGVMAALGAITLVVPLTGFVGTESSLALTGRAISVASDDSSSWADTGITGGRVAGNSDVNNEDSLVPSSLAAHDGAVARARVHEIQDGGCAPEDKTAARGDYRAITSMGENAIVYPLVSYRIASPFGYRIHPIYGVGRLHAGVDMTAPAMTPVHAVADGVVEKITNGGGQGHYIVIRHELPNGTNFESHYYHLTYNSEVVRVGQKVKAGQHIAGVGSTGASTGNHLHLEIHPNFGEPVDPIAWLKSHHAQRLGANNC